MTARQELAARAALKMLREAQRRRRWDSEKVRK
jgi:hypothetical protein